jgi:hypothetical protein
LKQILIGCGPAAVATAGEKSAAAHADGRLQRDSMRIDKIAQFRLKFILESPQRTRQYVSISRGLQRRHRVSDGVMKPLLRIVEILMVFAS